MRPKRKKTHMVPIAIIPHFSHEGMNGLKSVAINYTMTYSLIIRRRNKYWSFKKPK